MWSTRELIVAPATPRVAGCRSIVRFSGDGLESLLELLFDVAGAGAGFARSNETHRLMLATLSGSGLGRDWGAVPVEILHWPGPRGPTGGPLAEVQIPASTPLVDAVVAAACRHGARLARGGEFTLRAVLAGRLDLLQAEAVLSVVDANSPSELAAALDALAGGSGRLLRELRESLLDLAADVEATIDFSDETTPDAVAAGSTHLADVARRLDAVMAGLDDICRRLDGRDASAGAEAPRVVLAGPPNIGKSSLFNSLLGRDAALVADQPGTTRDWLTARFQADDSTPACILVDVAGLSQDAATGGGDVGHLAQARAIEEIARAAVVVACADASTGGSWWAGPVAPSCGDAVRIDVLTRCDRLADCIRDNDAYGRGIAKPIKTSSRTGQGIAELRAVIAGAVVNLPVPPASLTARTRVELMRAGESMAAARHSLEGGDPQAAADDAVTAALIGQAVAAIDQILGTEISTDLLDRIFSRHCIGK